MRRKTDALGWKIFSFCCPEHCYSIKRGWKVVQGGGWDYVKKKTEVYALGWNLLMIICEICLLMMISVVLNVLYERGMKGWGRGLILWRNSQMKSLCLVWNLFFLLMIYFIIVFLFGYLNFFGEIQALKTTKMERKHRSLSCIKYHKIPKC
jgi:hypothetical protein